jgi:hypothetical protein
MELDIPFEHPTAIFSLFAQSIVRQAASGSARQNKGLILTGKNALSIQAGAH